MQLRSVIIDDEEAGIENLRILIEKHTAGLKVVASASKASQGIRIIEDYQPEVVFLDITMPEMDGFELLERLEKRDFNLVFITAHCEYALKALKVNAVDYLLKPVDPAELQATVDRLQAQRNERGSGAHDYSAMLSGSPQKNARLAVTSKNGVEFLEWDTILCLESQSNYTRIFLSDGSVVTTPRTLGDFEDVLCDSGDYFMRVHHSFIINLHKVMRFNKEDDVIVLNNSQKVPLSKSRRASFFKWLLA